MIARPHLCVIAVGSRPPCAKAIISPARSHIAALMHLAVFPYFMIYSHHVLIKNPCGYLRIGISREAHLHSVIINRKFKPGRKQIVLRVKSKQRMRNFWKRTGYSLRQWMFGVYNMWYEKLILISIRNSVMSIYRLSLFLRAGLNLYAFKLVPA